MNDLLSSFRSHSFLTKANEFERILIIHWTGHLLNGAEVEGSGNENHHEHFELDQTNIDPRIAQVSTQLQFISSMLFQGVRFLHASTSQCEMYWVLFITEHLLDHVAGERFGSFECC
jgi:hypothetical protein